MAAMLKIKNTYSFTFNIIGATISPTMIKVMSIAIISNDHLNFRDCISLFIDTKVNIQSWDIRKITH
jgi:hypothetical protein